MLTGKVPGTLMDIPTDWEGNITSYISEAVEKNPGSKEILGELGVISKVIVGAILEDNGIISKAVSTMGLVLGKPSYAWVPLFSALLELIRENGFLLWMPAKQVFLTPTWGNMIFNTLVFLRAHEWINECHFLLLANSTALVLIKGKRDRELAKKIL